MNASSIQPGKATIVYAILASIWILLSDWLVAYSTNRAWLISVLQFSKGLWFVFFTSLALFFILKKLKKSENLLLLELQQQTHYYRQLFHDNPHPMWVFRLSDLKFIEVNQSAINHYGYSHQEFMSMTILDIRPKSEEERLRAVIANIKSPINHAGLWQHCKKNGSIIIVDIVSHSIIFNGEVARLVDIRDVTDLTTTKLELQTRNALLQRVFEGSHDGFWEWDVQGGIITFSRRWAEMLSRPDDQLSIHIDTWRSLIHPHDLPLCTQALEAHFSGKVPRYLVEYRVLNYNGDYIWIMARGKVYEWDANQQPLFMAGTHTDISERKKAEYDRLLIAKIFENSRESIVILDKQHKIIKINPAFCKITGYSLAEIQKFGLNILHSKQNSRDFFTRAWQQVAEQGYWEGEVWNQRKDGSTYSIWLSVIALDNPQQHELPEHFVCIASDISSLRAAEQRIQSMAYHDALTGLPNRILLREHTEKLLNKAHHYGQSLSFLFIDLDQFKRINDTLGHSSGDQILVKFSEFLKSQLRKSDIACRIGSDEFVLLLAETDAYGAERVARKIIERSWYLTIAGHTLNISASVGISVYPDDAENFDLLLAHADAAMHRAKSQGRRRWCHFTADMDAQAQERLHIESELRQVLNGEHLFLLYQPQWKIKSGRICSVEALVRWQHPKNGLLPPSQFISVAEESGLIIEIGDWVLRTACESAARWRENGVMLDISVNVSPLQFREANFVQRVRRALDHSGLMASNLELEITESILIDEHGQPLQVIQELKNLGVRIALDDFGTGYSNLAYFKRLPLDRIKIDQSFIRDLEHSESDRQLVAGIIALAHSLHMEVIAEGVASLEQRDYLRALNCEMGQGYWLSKPLTEADLLTWLAELKGIRH